MNKRIQKKKHLGKFREYGIQCELNFIENTSISTALDTFLNYIESQGWCAGGGCNSKSMSPFITYDEWADTRKTTYKNLTQEDADNLKIWLKQQPWCAEITVLEIRDAWYNWHWTEKEPDKSKIERALRWATENAPQETDLNALIASKNN